METATPHRLSERSFAALHLLACIHLECGQASRAASYVRYLLSADPTRCALWRILATALLRLQRNEEALTAIEHAAALAASPAEIAGTHLTRARILSRLHRTADAEVSAELSLSTSATRP
jgi:Flp pilus assembly protein TadD